MCDLELLAGKGIRVVGEKVVDLGIGDDNLAIHLALAQAGQQDLGANLVAEARPRHAVPVQRGAQLIHAEFVVGGDAVDGALERGVVHPQRGLARELELGTLDDETFEQLAFEHLGRRQFDVLALQLAYRLIDTGTQLQGGNDFVVDHRNDAIDLDGSGRRMRGQAERSTGEAGCQQKTGTGQGAVHGIQG